MASPVEPDTQQLLDRARRGDHSAVGQLLDRYRDDYGRDDGTFCYYGPAISEYGQMLALVVRVWELCRDDGWLEAWLPEVRAMVKMLREKWQAARTAHKPDHPCHGIIFGLPEADFTSTDTQGCYYSGSAWAWRGFVSVGRALRSLAEQAKQEDLAQEAEVILSDAAQMRQDLEASIRRTQQPDFAPPFVPDLAERTKPCGYLTEDRDASYANYRYYPELLSAGVLSEGTALTIREFRRQRGGECLGTTRLRDRLDDWPASHWARALMELGLRNDYLLLFYGHLAHHLSQGTYSAYEQVQIDPASPRASLFRNTSFALGDKPIRMEVADYCIPAQLTTPLMTRWMLLWEERDRDVLWLFRGAPSAWFGEGKRIRLKGVPTRWGVVSVDVQCQDHCQAQLTLPEAGLAAEIRLCMAGRKVESVTVDGEPVSTADQRENTLLLAPGMAGMVNVEFGASAI